MGPDEEMEAANRRAWATASSVRIYRNQDGWLGPGEKAALSFVADHVRDQPALDLGVGAGRTVPLVRALTDDYVAIDYTPEMVEACRAAHPGVDVREMDARDLSAFADGSFAFVLFSNNGIDAVPPADRDTVLREIHRVLRPGGWVVLGAHNHDGPLHGENLRDVLMPHGGAGPLRTIAQVAKRVGLVAWSVPNRLRLRHLNRPGRDLSVMNAGAAHFGLVVVYTTQAEQRRELAEVGLHPQVVFGTLDEQPIDADADTSRIGWLTYVAQKPLPHKPTQES